MSFNAKSFSTDDIAPTTQTYIPAVIDRTGCVQHNALSGFPCYEFQGADNDLWHVGICNSRARRAGMNGSIHPSSLRTSPSKQTVSRG